MFGRVNAMVHALFSMPMGGGAPVQAAPTKPRDDGANVVILPDAVWRTKGRKKKPVSMASQKRASAKRRQKARR